MSKNLIWSVAIPLILLSMGLLFVGALGYAMSPDWLSAQEIQEAARKVVPEPTYPPAPQSRTSVQSKPREICTQIPIVRGSFPPKIEMKQNCITINEPVPVVDGPSTAETREWQERLTARRVEYDRAVQQEASRLSERQRSDLKAYVKDMIQISAGILGLISGIVALAFGARRGGTAG